MKTPKYNLVCVAHPDDETLFFGGLLQRRNKLPWMVVCATDANADGDGKHRFSQFKKACTTLGVDHIEWWGFPDRFEKRLPSEELIARLQDLPRPNEIFTHGIMGEYRHPHHQDVSYCVHQAFAKHPKVYSVAYNTYPTLKIQLTKKEYETKARILTRIYGSETTRFLNLLPATFTEGFLQLEASEVSALYDFFAHGKSLQTKKLKTHAWLASYLKQNPSISRPF
jgi:LmbE family N-acetylglucosaminyl deacetylase